MIELIKYLLYNMIDRTKMESPVLAKSITLYFESK